MHAPSPHAPSTFASSTHATTSGKGGSPRPTTAGSSMLSSSTEGAPAEGLLAADEPAAYDEDQPFLWEQISSSIDAVELEEVQRVVGFSLVNACGDIYAELRALRDIHREFAAATDELLKKSTSLPRATSSAPAGLVQLELKSLVAQLRKRAADTGVPEDALLPVPSSPHRKALESVLREEGDGGGGGNPERGAIGQTGRPGTSDSQRISLREMRLGSRPSTASQDSAILAASRPVTAASAQPIAPAPPPGGPASTAPRSPRATKSASGGGSRPASARPASAASSVGSIGSAGGEGGFGGEGVRASSRASSRASTESRSGLVVSRLRAALEEERQALLAQAEALRLSIDDETEYRDRVAQPAPSLTSLLELKRSLQEVLSRSEATPALDAAAASSAAAAARGRGELSSYGAPLPQLSKANAGSAAPPS